MQNQLVEAITAMVHSRDAAGQRAVELQVQRPQQQWQLIGVRIKREPSAPFLDHLKVLAVDGLERRVFGCRRGHVAQGVSGCRAMMELRRLFAAGRRRDTGS